MLLLLLLLLDTFALGRPVRFARFRLGMLTCFRALPGSSFEILAEERQRPGRDREEEHAKPRNMQVHVFVDAFLFLLPFDVVAIRCQVAW